jgi:hypothetical protein
VRSEWGVFVLIVAAGLLLGGCEQPANDITEKQETFEEAGEEYAEVPVYEKLTAIEIVSAPDITYYALNQPFDTTGLAVKGVYYRYIGYDEAPGSGVEPDEAVTRLLDPSVYTVETPDTSDGNRPVMVAVKCAGLPSETFPVYISNSPVALNKVELLSLPSKTNYELEEDFSKSGLQVRGTYSDGSTADFGGSMCQVKGYDSRKRGAQTVTLRLNGMAIAEIPVTVKVPASATVVANSINTSMGYTGWSPAASDYKRYYRPVFIKGTPLVPANITGLWVNVKTANGKTVTLSCAENGITDNDAITDYDSLKAGMQHPNLNLDGVKVPLEVFFTDAEPEIWFDYGFMRHNKDHAGRGRGAGKYYCLQGETLVLSPVRFLIGYDGDHNDIGAAYDWQVSGGSYTNSPNGEFLYFTPSGAGAYDISVSVTGRNFVDGKNVTKSASTQVVAFTGTVTDSGGIPFVSGKPLKNFSPGQFTKGGTGHGWSLGTALGYEMWSIPSSTTKITIQGNGFNGWHEEGIVWVQEDRNGNGIADEMWYEVTGSLDDDAAKRNYIVRRYAIKHLAYEGSTQTTEWGQPVGKTFFTDSRGRCGVMITGWPDDWGVDKAAAGVWVTYTGTVLASGGPAIYNSKGWGAGLTGYVDGYNANGGQTMTVDKSRAIRADGSKANIGTIRFVKVQTGVFSFGGGFGDISTEIVRATGIDGDQSGGFPNPLGNVKTISN